MDKNIYGAFIQSDGELNTIIKELVEKASRIDTPVDDWMKNDDEYTNDMRYVKMLIARAVKIVDERMCFDEYLQVGFPVVCSMLNFALRRRGIHGNFSMDGDNINMPWISYRADSSCDEFGIECSFLTQEEWEEYLTLYKQMSGVEHSNSLNALS